LPLIDYRITSQLHAKMFNGPPQVGSCLYEILYRQNGLPVTVSPNQQFKVGLPTWVVS